jgi:hypothetical protein
MSDDAAATATKRANRGDSWFENGVGADSSPGTRNVRGGRLEASHEPAQQSLRDVSASPGRRGAAHHDPSVPRVRERVRVLTNCARGVDRHTRVDRHMAPEVSR